MLSGEEKSMERTFGVNEISFCYSTGYLKRDQVDQFCPFFGKNSEGVSVRCGTWCPHFMLRRDHQGGVLLTITCGSGAHTMTIEREVDG